jgi:hypothetical protein
MWEPRHVLAIVFGIVAIGVIAVILYWLYIVSQIEF